MGWRDINLNRRKPKIDVAVVDVAAGEDRTTAVLRKAAAQARAAAGEGNARFTAGYLAGYARQQALKHGVDAEHDMAALVAQLATGAPEAVRAALAGLGFAPRSVASPRAGLAASDVVADAGYLVGHLAARCGARALTDLAGGPEAYLTRCDQAADRLQTHQPTAVLRLDPAERAIVAQALASLD